MELVSKLPWIYIIPIVLSVALIRLFYRAFKNTWPELYFSVSDYTSLYISFSPLRYFAFTLLPTIIISAFVFSAFMRNFHIQFLPQLGLFVGFMHTVTTNGVALWKLITRNSTISTFFNKPFQMFVHVITMLAITGCGYMGGFLGEQPFLVPFIPTWGVIDNLWAALFSSILTIGLYRIYTNKYNSETDIVSQSKSRLSAAAINHIGVVCEKYQAKKSLVMAICITENIQRPLWVRKLERIKSFVFKSGTYGIMQVQSKNYIDDFKSIDLAVEKYFKYTNAYTTLDSTMLNEIFSKYNSDAKFIQFAIAAFYEQEPRG